MKYFLYARKSTDEEDRQMLSIEAQVTELKEFAAKEPVKNIDSNFLLGERGLFSPSQVAKAVEN